MIFKETQQWIFWVQGYDIQQIEKLLLEQEYPRWVHFYKEGLEVYVKRMVDIKLILLVKNHWKDM